MLHYANPRLNGYVYRRKKRCGKPNCRCAKDAKYRHTVYQLQYRDLGKQRSEHVPKTQVGALRARIKKNKERDKLIRKILKDFLAFAKLVRRGGGLPLNACGALPSGFTVPRSLLLETALWTDTIGRVLPDLSVLQVIQAYSASIDIARALEKTPCETGENDLYSLSMFYLAKHLLDALSDVFSTSSDSRIPFRNLRYIPNKAWESMGIVQDLIPSLIV